MKLPRLGIPMQDKVPMYLARLFALTTLVMVIFQIPVVLNSWEDAANLQRKFRISIAGMIFFVMVAYWVFTHRSQYLRKDRIQLGFLFMAFFFNPILSFINLAITSDGFKDSPVVLGNEQLYLMLDDIQLYIFAALGIGSVIWFARQKSQANNLDNPDSAGEHV